MLCTALWITLHERWTGIRSLRSIQKNTIPYLFFDWLKIFILLTNDQKKRLCLPVEREQRKCDQIPDSYPDVIRLSEG